MECQSGKQGVLFSLNSHFYFPLYSPNESLGSGGKAMKSAYFAVQSEVYFIEAYNILLLSLSRL